MNTIISFKKKILENPHLIYGAFIGQATDLLNIQELLDIAICNFESLYPLLGEKLLGLKFYGTSNWDTLTYRVKVAEGLSTADEMLSLVRNKQKWGLIPFVSLFGIIYPSAFVKRLKAILMKRKQFRFLQHHLENSTECQKLHEHLTTSRLVSSNRMSIYSNYITPLERQLFTTVLMLNTDTIVQTAAILDIYRISRKDILFLKEAGMSRLNLARILLEEFKLTRIKTNHK